MISANADSFGAAREVPSPAWVMVVAHRGDHTAAHENSLEAIENAIRDQTSFIWVEDSDIVPPALHPYPESGYPQRTP